MSQQQPRQEIRQDREETQQNQPGTEHEMVDKPVYIREGYRSAGKLKGRVAVITGGDSGIGRSVAVHFAREGADVCIIYLEERQDAEDTRALVESEGVRCNLYSGDVGDSKFCEETIAEVVEAFGQIDILVNNAAEQHSHDDLGDIPDEEFESTFRTNVFGYFHMMKWCLPHMKSGARIINTSSVTAYRGSKHLADYAGTKGAIQALTRSVAQQVADRGITVNAVAPGPIWTPLIPASFDEERLREFGKDTLLGRPGQPWEAATCFVFLASADGDYLTGQTLHPNGGGFLGS